MKLSKDFYLEEFVSSPTATRHNIDNEPSPSVIEELTKLCVEIMQPIRNYFERAVIISSGYRCLELNTLIGGSKTSQHMKGQAADFHINTISTATIVDACIKLSLPYHQLINEFGRWVHISKCHQGSEPGKQVMTAVKQDGKTVYKRGQYA